MRFRKMPPKRWGCKSSNGEKQNGTSEALACRGAEGDLIMDANTQEEWLTSAEAAEYLGLSVRTLERMKFREAIRSKLVGKAPSGRQRLYQKASLEEFKTTRIRQKLISSRPKITPQQYIFDVQE